MRCTAICTIGCLRSNPEDDDVDEEQVGIIEQQKMFFPVTVRYYVETVVHIPSNLDPTRYNSVTEYRR